MKMKESNETKVKESKAFIRRLEHENADLKFLNNQYMQRLITQEKESQAKSERIMTLQEKNSQAVIQTPGGRKRQLPYRRQRMDIDAVLEPSASSKRLPPPVVPPPDPTVVNLLKVADERMTSLQTSLKKCEDEKGQLQGTVQDMKKQVERREEEINRLSSQLRGGRPPEALAMEGKVETNERMVAHLNIQVDFLQQANQKLESDLMDSEKIQEELRLKVDDLSSKNSRICTELQEIGGLVKEMENERQKNETSLKSEIDNLLQQCANLHQTIQEYEQKKDENTKAQQELFSENRKMAELLATSEVDAEQAAEVIEQLSKENRQLRKMNHQITTAKDSSGSVDGSVDIQKLIKERNELKNVVENFETELMQIRQDAMTLKQDRDNIQLLYSQVNEELNKYRHEPGQSSQPSSQPNAGVNFGRLSRVERERDDAKLEVKQLTLECNSLKERLRIMKEGKEKEEMTEEIEIDKLHLQIENLTKEHSNLKEHSESLRRVVDSLEKELEQSTTALSTCQDENKALRKKLKTIEGTLGALQRTKEEENRGIRQQLAQSEVTSAEVVQLKSHISHLEDDVRRKGEKIDELSNALKTIDQEFDHLRSECDNKDEELCEMKKELKNKVNHILI
jgi:centrosomal protein CEP135